jgi:predicted nuclease of restriction endonuclease-like (RecB) superfamily
MRAFAEAWPDVVQQPVGQLPWGHITVLIDKLDDADLREWYASQAVNGGWGRNVLLNQIMSKLHQRLGPPPPTSPAPCRPESPSSYSR